jgi:hypothetical protein
MLDFLHKSRISNLNFKPDYIRKIICSGRIASEKLLKRQEHRAVFALILKEMEGVSVSSPQWNMPGVSASSSTGWDEPEKLQGLFTCLACQTGFHSADLQRQHYRTDW